MNKKLVSILLCCWPEDLLDGANEIWTNRKIEDALVQVIRNGDIETLNKLFDKGFARQDIYITVYRKNLQHLCNCWLEHNSKDSIIYFYQESNPLLWSIDCHQWDLFRAMIKRGIDPNRPLICRRWTSFYSKLNVVPYSKSWIKGKCTYQSALDYYLASIFETMTDNINHTLIDYHDYFDDFVDILQSGVDVHRIDSIIIFNQLATSFNLALRRYDIIGNQSSQLDNDDSANIYKSTQLNNNLALSKQNQFTEIKIFNLIENDFSQLDNNNYLKPNFQHTIQ